MGFPDIGKEKCDFAKELTEVYLIISSYFFVNATKKQIKKIFLLSFFLEKKRNKKFKAKRCFPPLCEKSRISVKVG
jgi:hypothetical protein